ncbi:MAG TPA: hydantoinase/oxoprolinase family protein [Alphaproteobacteria bacterium]
MTRYAIAVDIGGTFTDVVLRDDQGRTWVDKTLTTHEDLLEGFFRAVDLVLKSARVGPAEVDDVVVHATTIVTNAVIERKGPRTALLVTEGFRDVLKIRDEHRYDMFDPQIEFPEPLVPRELTYGVPERTLADGTIERDVDTQAVARIAEELRRQKVASVAISLLNSYRNPRNEQVIRDHLQELAPEIYVSLSSDVAPQIREYPRTSTVVLNAYTMPIVQPYLKALSERLRARKFKNDALIMLSSGGVIGAEIAGRFPVRMIESGPAAGALAACHFAEMLGLDRLLSFDMGGTTAKACIIESRKPLVTGTFEVDRMYRFKQGSGLPVLIPAIDLIEIGAGGGSIATVDDLGLLKVGPRSAGSDPGPACYGRNGKDATVTDADLVLGFLDADNFLGGEMKLDRAAAETNIATLAERLGTDIGQTASGIFRVVGESMASAARAHATDRGVDYRGVPLLAFGGAGPVHACYVADLLDSPQVIYPPLASVLSAFGTLVTPPRMDLVRGALSRLGDIDWADVTEILDQLCAEGRDDLVEAGCPADKIAYVFGGDMRYFGQQNEVTVTFDADPRVARDAAALRRAFEAAYKTLYGVQLDDVEVEIVNWRVTVTGPATGRASRPALPAEPGAPKARRTAWVNGGPEPVDVFDRTALAAGQEIAGPAIIEERETTIVLLAGWRAKVDQTGCIVATKG